MEFKNLEGLTDEQIKRLASFAKDVLEVQGSKGVIDFISALYKAIASELEDGCNGVDYGWVIRCLAEYTGIINGLESGMYCSGQSLFEYTGVKYELGVFGEKKDK